MMKTTLLKKLEAAIDEAMSQRLYGNIEIEFRAGHPTFLSTHRQEKLDEAENRSYGTYNR